MCNVTHSKTWQCQPLGGGGFGTRVWAEKYQNEFILYCFLFLSCLIGGSALIFQEARKEKTRKRKIRAGRGVGWKDGRAGSYRNWAAQMKEMNRKITSRCSTFFLLRAPPPSLWTFLFFVLVLAQFSSIAHSRPTLCDPMDCSTPGLPSITSSRSLLRLMSVVLVMSSNHLILYHPLLLLPSIFPSDSVHWIRWPKYWEFQLQHQSFQWTFRTYFL